MARRPNELFIGTDYLSVEGNSNKHPALIRLYANPNVKKITNEPLNVIGLDIETNHLTGEMKLLGVYDGEYQYYTDKFLSVIVSLVHKAKGQQKALAYWNRLDPLTMYRVLLSELKDDESRNRSMDRYGRVGGEYDKKHGRWDVPPVLELELDDGELFGIKQVIRSSVQFYYKRPWDEDIQTVWAYDIAQLFPGHLEKEASRFKWYSKVSEEAHVVDWERFDNDKQYRNDVVLYSNKLDARACYELAYIIQEDFYSAFNAYPRNLISQGALARAAVVAELVKKYENDFQDDKELDKKISEEFRSIGIMNYYDEWAEKFGAETMKDLYALSCEAYSGGQIDAIHYGSAGKGWYADIASAYPGIIQNLDDLRGAEIKQGKGAPPKPEHGYVLIRGTVHIPQGVDYHPLTVKHPVYQDTNIRPVGTFKGAYIYEEREYLRARGATFEDEVWYHIKTAGKKSVLAEVCERFIDLRRELQEQNSSSEYMAKISANSLYGILYEAVDTHEEREVEKTYVETVEGFYKEVFEPYRKNLDLTEIKEELKYRLDNEYQKVLQRWHNANAYTSPEELKMELKEQGVHLENDHPADILMEVDTLYQNEQTKYERTYTTEEVRRNGYRAGEFWNPIYATIITAKTRLLMSKASDAIAKNGGKPIVLMTDSITWEGQKDDMPQELWRSEKTLGYFEEPEPVYNIVCLGTGRYGFEMSDGSYVSKRRGLNATDIHSPDGVVLGGFDWNVALDIMKENKTDEVDMNVRMLNTIGIILHRKDLTYKDIARIVEEKRTVKALAGLHKRWLNLPDNDIGVLKERLVKTDPIILAPGMFGENTVPDLSLPILRKEMMEKKLITKKQRKRKTSKKTSNKHYGGNKEKILKKYRENYRLLRMLGFKSKDAEKWSKFSDEKLEKKLREAGYDV